MVLICFGFVQFFFCVLLIFIIEVVGGVLAFVFYPDAEQVAIDSMSKYNEDSPQGNSIKTGWDALQEGVSCRFFIYFMNFNQPEIKNPLF